MTSLRITDQETARTVAVHHESKRILGAGCLVDNKHVLTCRHVVEATGSSEIGSIVHVSLIGVPGQPTYPARLARLETKRGPQNDLALLELPDNDLEIPAAEFASPLRHGGKHYSVLGFPGGDPQGRNAAGLLHATNATGLVQMDRGGALSVLGGFSGAPVWCSDVAAFVGLVVRELSSSGVSWCIPSRRLCAFFPELLVRFRIPPADRPQIHDYEIDEPNLQLFGSTSRTDHYELTVTVKENDDDELDVDWIGKATYRCLDGAQPRGGYVTFVMYPDYEDEDQDAYELFARIEKGKASVYFYPEDTFVLAAVGDAGDVALTFDIAKARLPKGFGT